MEENKKGIRVVDIVIIVAILLVILVLILAMTGNKNQGNMNFAEKLMVQQAVDTFNDEEVKEKVQESQEKWNEIMEKEDQYLKDSLKNMSLGI